MNDDEELPWWRDWDFLRPYAETALVLTVLLSVGFLGYLL